MATKNVAAIVVDFKVANVAPDYTKKTDDHPAFLDKDGVLLPDLKISKKKDFSKKQAGKVAFCTYQMAVYAAKRALLLEGKDEKVRISEQIKKEERRLAELRGKLKELGG